MPIAEDVELGEGVAIAHPELVNRRGRGTLGREHVQASIALFCGLVSLGIAGIGYLARYGFSDDSPLFWVKFVGLSWFLVTFSLLVRKLPPVRDARGPWQSWAGHGSLTLAGLGLTALFGFDAGPALSRAIPFAFAAVGCAGFVLGCWSVARTARLRDIAAVVGFAGVFAIYGACVSCGTGYQNMLMVEGISFKGCQIDELYHASICNMLRTYGVASTGLDGVPFQPYHFGSHWLFARLCNLLDVRVIDFYSRGYRVVFVPFGVFCLSTFAAAVAEARSLRESRAGLDLPIIRRRGCRSSDRTSVLDNRRTLLVHRSDGLPELPALSRGWHTDLRVEQRYYQRVVCRGGGDFAARARLGNLVLPGRRHAIGAQAVANSGSHRLRRAAHGRAQHAQGVAIHNSGGGGRFLFCAAGVASLDAA